MSKRPLASGLPAKPITTPTQVSTKLPPPSSTRSAPPRPPRVNNNSHINQPGLAPPLPAGPPPPLLNVNGNGPYGVGPQAFPGAIPPQQYQQQQQQQAGAMSYQQQQPGQVDPAAHAAAWAAYYAVRLLTSLASRRITQYGMIRRAGCWMKKRYRKRAADTHRRKDSPTRTPPLQVPSLPILPAQVAPTLHTQTTATAWGPRTATTSTLNSSLKHLSHSSLHTAHLATSTPPLPVLHPRPTVLPELDPYLLLSSTAAQGTSSSSSSSSRGSITLSRNRNKDRLMAISALLRVSPRYLGMAAPRRRCLWRGRTRSSRVSRPCRSSLRLTSRTFRAISIISSHLRLRRHRWRGTKPGQADKDKGSGHQGRVRRARRRTGHTALDHLPGKAWACRAG